MLDKNLELYILKMESIKIIKETIEKNVPTNVNKNIDRYKDAILMDVYFGQLLNGEIDTELEQYVKKYVTVNEVDANEKKISYKFNRVGDGLNPYKSLGEARKIYSISEYTLVTMYNNILLSILIEFENIIGRILKKIITAYPEPYVKDKNISYAKVIESKDINDVKEKIIDNEVDSLMRENIFEWMNILQRKHGIIIQVENLYVQKFIEAYLRRNIIVHNDSKVNQDYINGMKKAGKTISEKSIGKKLLCTKTYIENVIDASIYTIICICYNSLKLFKDEEEKLVDKMIEFGFEKIKNEEYDLAREIHKLIKDNDGLDQQSRIYALINYWQTFKWSNKYEEVKDEIDKFDISAYEDLIKLAVFALREEYDNLSDLLNSKFSEDKQNEELAIQLEEFPIFKEVRKKKFYKELKENYPEAFSIKSTLVNEENEEKGEMVENTKGVFKVTLGIEKVADNKKEKKEVNS